VFGRASTVTSPAPRSGAGNHLAAVSGAGLRDLMARMGHDSERAAIIYQHRARGADELITTAIDAHIQAEQGRRAGGG